MPRKTVSEIFTEFLTAKQADAVSAVYLKDLRFRVGKFAGAFQGQMADVDAAQVNKWLWALKCGPRGRNNYRLAISSLFKFAESLGYVAKGHLDFDRIAKAREVFRTLIVHLGLHFDECPKDVPAILAPLVTLLLDVRGKLRLAKQWALADEIRDQLLRAGIIIEDRPAGPSWHRKQ